MDFVEIISILDVDLVRGCILYKSFNLMQKTINYTATSTFSININSQTFNNINQLLFIVENNVANIYLTTNNQVNKTFSLNEIETLEVSV